MRRAIVDRPLFMALRIFLGATGREQAFRSRMEELGCEIPEPRMILAGTPCGAVTSVASRSRRSRRRSMQTAFSVPRILSHLACWQRWRIPDSFQKKQACWRSATVIPSTVNTTHHRSALSIFQLRRWQRSVVIICTGICIHPLQKRRPVTLRPKLYARETTERK